MEKYIIAIKNSNLLGLDRKIQRFGKGQPLESWDESQLIRFCRMNHIKTAEEKGLDAELRHSTLEYMQQIGITSTFNSRNTGKALYEDLM